MRKNNVIKQKFTLKDYINCLESNKIILTHTKGLETKRTIYSRKKLTRLH